MKRRKNSHSSTALESKYSNTEDGKDIIGVVLSGGGARAAYQVGALKALIPYFKQSSSKLIILGSSIGAINGLMLAAGLNEDIETSVDTLEQLWRKRNFRNTFRGAPSMAFFRAIKVALYQYMSPGPNPSSDSVFDPSPLREELDSVIKKYGGLSLRTRSERIHTLGVMTTIEGEERKPLLFLSAKKDIEKDDPALNGASFQVYNVKSLTATHGFASAALPSILPPVEIDTTLGKIRLVDGGIANNLPVDPAVRLGASRVMLLDVSGRNWWLKKYNKSGDQRPEWEIPAEMKTFCLRPPDTFIARCKKPLGPIFKHAVSGSTKKFIKAVGPIWPLFSLLKNKLGEEVAYETMSYVALDHDYLAAIIEQGYTETRQMLRDKETPEFAVNKTFEDLAEEVTNSE